jgi:cyclophilin family peptidyl-prolyl cis-trans isomerase
VLNWFTGSSSRLRRDARARVVEVADQLIEGLEQRLALYSSPFLTNLPQIADLSNPNNTVVRMEVPEGFIDIELFDAGGPNGGTAAPLTVANFLKYVNSGRYTNTFFHRLEANFVLQGGGYSLIDPLPSGTPKYTTITKDSSVKNEFSSTRSNLERTLAMAKFSDQPDSATSEFFFNLKDNSSNLDGQNGGFTVFARVIKGWDVVQTITGLTTQNLNEYLSGNQSTAFDKVPLTGADNSDVVSIKDIEVIKPKNTGAFYTETLYFPQGLRAAVITNDVAMVNTDLGGSAAFQIIARYEAGIANQVILTGTMEAGASRTVRVSLGGDPTINRVRGGEYFAYEIRATRKIAAQLLQYENGVLISQAFVATAPIFKNQLEDWAFATGQKGPGFRSSVSFLNVTDQPVTITITFTSETGTTYTTTRIVKPYMRGGINVNNLTQVPDGSYAVRLTSDQPIVVSQLQYRLSPAQYSIETGVPQEGGTQGVLPGARIPSNGASTISFVYNGGTGTNSVLVDVDFVLSNGTVISGSSPVTLTNLVPRREVDLTSLASNLPLDSFFTIRYKVRDGTTKVAGSYSSVYGGGNSLFVRTAFQVLSTQKVYFAGGALNPTDSTGQEIISLYNPYSSDANTTVSYTIRFHFLDSPQQEVISPTDGTGTIAANGRVDISVRSFSDVIARINSGANFRRYAISIETTITKNGQTITGSAIFAQMTRIQGGNTVSSVPGLSTEKASVLLSDPRFTTA